MGMNLVNTMAPLAAAVQAAPADLPAVPRPADSEAQPLDYAVLPYTVAVVDELIFSKAEAADYVVPDGGTSNINIGSMSAGDTMSVASGGTGVIGSMDVTVTSSAYSSSYSSEYQSGGTATAGYTSAYSGVSYNFGTSGTQVITDGGTGIIESNLGGTQVVDAGGSGHVGSLGAQVTSYINGYMDGHSHYINNTAYSSSNEELVFSKNGGTQVINNGGTGTIDINDGGTQLIASVGRGHIGTLGMMLSSASGVYSSSYDSGNGGTALYSGGSAYMSSVAGGV